MARFYLDQDALLAAVPIKDLTVEQVRAAINERCIEERITITSTQSAQILREAGVDVDLDTLTRLQKLVK